ncbi:cation diffusion facilitator family transporter [uncultured Bacteroides sp.]|uniref:cation diffusion facilitator family transporter n=1 Tax=uncultured Bacteroides sp. TaxID=162156 RepID=UPI002609AB51|nr:cation diffusion facilitator family transporter [uncultured Bacteroides sp.]
MDKTDVALREKELYKVTLVGSLVNVLLVVCKFVAGVLGHSAAMVADAVHSLSDLVTDVIVLVFVRVSGKPADKNHDYGHGKYETLATLLIGAALLAVGIGIFWNGAEQIIAFAQGEKLNSPGWIALGAALVSILAKEFLFHYTRRVGKLFESPAVIANAWHHRSDALSSIGTAVGIGGAILLGENWRVLDPIAAVVVSLFIIRVSFKQLKPCIDELLEQSLPEEVERQITEIVLSEEGVSEPHHLRTRRIGSHYAIDMHIRMNGEMKLHDAHVKATSIEHKLRDVYGKGTYINLHVEPEK